MADLGAIRAGLVDRGAGSPGQHQEVRKTEGNLAIADQAGADQTHTNPPLAGISFYALD